MMIVATAFPLTSYLKQVAKNLEVDFKENPTFICAGNAMLEFLVTVPPQQSSDLSLGSIRNIIKRFGNSFLTDDQIIELSNYFVGGRVRLLDMLFSFLDKETGEMYPISFEIMKSVWQGKPFYHPVITDEEVKDFEERIIVTYVPSKLAKDEYFKLHPRTIN